jgi:glycerol-3-phosphate acyltransferase PlsY
LQQQNKGGNIMAMVILATAAAAYLLGSVNFAIIVSGLYAKDDVRKHGSGNAGMTNILRTYGKAPAAITAAGDLAKTVMAVFLAKWIFARAGILDIDPGYIAGLFVILGHVYPLYFGFRGGKGVITTLGVMMVVNPVAFLVIVAIFVPLIFITKIVSLSSVLGAVLYPILTYGLTYLQNGPLWYNTGFALLYAAIVLYGHRDNIKRLLKGEENKFGQKKK